MTTKLEMIKTEREIRAFSSPLGLGGLAFKDLFQSSEEIIFVAWPKIQNGIRGINIVIFRSHGLQWLSGASLVSWPLISLPSKLAIISHFFSVMTRSIALLHPFIWTLIWCGSGGKKFGWAKQNPMRQWCLQIRNSLVSLFVARHLRLLLKHPFH